MSVTLAAISDKTDDGSAASEHRSSASPAATSGLGISVAEADGQVVVAHVVPDGPADGKLRRGDVIEEIDRQPVTGRRERSRAKVQGGCLGPPDPLAREARRPVALCRDRALS